MRYSHSTGLYALAMSTVLGACDNGAKVPASALEQNVANAQESSKIDLSTPEAAIHALMSGYPQAKYLDQRILTSEFYTKIKREEASNPNRFSKKPNVESYEILSTHYENTDKAVVEVSAVVDGKKKTRNSQSKSKTAGE